MSSDMRTALLDALGRYDVPPGPERVNFTFAFAAGWNAAANPEGRSAVPSSHVSETDRSSVPSDRALLVDRCVPPLPNPEHTRDECDGMHGWWKERTGGFTAEQMEEHAKATLAAFADLLGIMIASATQIVDGDAVVGYEIKTGALHRMLGMFGGSVHIPLGLPSREAVCAELASTTASAPANSESNDSCVACHPPEFAPMPAQLKKWPLEDIYAQGCLDGWRTGESILREALARLVAKLDEIEANPSFRGIWIFLDMHRVPYKGPNWKAELEAARSALAGT